ncbi:MAG: hypothetical protein HC841_09255 [Verrucomicrobiae bacterium]|nr:hypothetical protein [Verrucomicrobiae bacterium]
MAVDTRFGQWLKRNGFLDEEGPEEQELDGWWTAAAKEPSGVLATLGPRRSSRWEVDARVRVAAGDEKGRLQLCLYVARPPFAEAQLEVLDEDRVGLSFRSPMRSGQRDLVLHPLALIPHLQTRYARAGGTFLRTKGRQACPPPRRVRRLAWLVPPPSHCPRDGSNEPYRRAY